MARQVRRPNSRGGARDPTRNQKGSTWGGGVSSTPGAAPTGSSGGVRTPTPTGNQRGNTWGGNVSSTPGAARTGSGGGVNAPPATQGSVVLLPDGSRVLVDVNVPLPAGGVVEPGGYPRPDGNTPEQKSAATPPADTPPPLPDYGNDLTPDEASIQENEGYNKVRNDIFGGIAAQRIATGEQYGVDVNTGLISDNVDITNPYSRAAMMNRSYATNKASNMNSYANRGLLTSGAYARRLASAAQTNNQNRAGLEQDWTTASLGWKGQENQADADLARARVAANRSLIERRMATDAAVFERKDVPKDPTPPPPDYTSFLSAIATKLTTPKPPEKPTPKPPKKPTPKPPKKPSGKKGGKK